MHDTGEFPSIKVLAKVRDNVLNKTTFQIKKKESGPLKEKKEKNAHRNFSKRMVSTFHEKSIRCTRTDARGTTRGLIIDAAFQLVAVGTQYR